MQVYRHLGSGASPETVSGTAGLWFIIAATTPAFSVVAAHLLTDDEKMPPNRLAGVEFSREDRNIAAFEVARAA